MAVLLGVLLYAQEYADPRLSGPPAGVDVGSDTAYLAEFRRALLEHGQLATWYGVASDGMPLLGHPLTHAFYFPLVVPVLLFGTAAGIRIAYVFSLLMAGTGMFALSRVIGAGILQAIWAGLVFVYSGSLAARLFAGHVEKVLAVPLLPWILAFILLANNKTGRQRPAWAGAAGLLHGLIFVSGESYLAVYLLAAVPLALTVGLMGRPNRLKVFLGGVSAWALGFGLAVAGKSIAALDVLAGSTRTVSAFEGSQDWYWAFAHMAYPFFLFGPVAPWTDLPRVNAAGLRGTVPWHASGYYGWWEYTQYIGAIPVICALGALAAYGLRMPNDAWPKERQRNVLALVAFVAVGAFWLANASWYSPINWAYHLVPGLTQFRVPSRALMIATPATLALAVLGFQGISKWARKRGRAVRLAVICLSIVAVVDVYSVTHWTPRVGQAAFAPALRRSLLVLREQDSTLFAATWEGFDRAWSQLPAVDWRESPDSTFYFELAEHGVRLAKGVAPLSPVSESTHKVITPERRVRYTFTPGQPPTGPGMWSLLLSDSGVTTWVNTQATATGWLLSDGQVSPVADVRAEVNAVRAKASAESGDTLIVNVNAFPGWWVSVNSSELRPVRALDGYIATPTQPGEVDYYFVYEAPRLPLILSLTALGWAAMFVLGLWLVPRLHPNRTNGSADLGLRTTPTREH